MLFKMDILPEQQNNKLLAQKMIKTQIPHAKLRQFFTS
jgi:hypothetical protein